MLYVEPAFFHKVAFFRRGYGHQLGIGVGKGYSHRAWIQHVRDRSHHAVVSGGW